MHEVLANDIFSETCALFLEAGLSSPVRDVELIMEHFSGISRVEMILSPKRSLSRTVVSAIRQACVRRLSGESVHRILGFREFYGVSLYLSPVTFEPRSDTEILVDSVLPFVRQTIACKGECRMLDLGTGTGAVALALMSQEAYCMVVATDIDPAVLEVASVNATQSGFSDRFSFQESDWFKNLTGRFDLIISNPPYIKNMDIASLEREVRDFDPHLALDGGVDGLNAYRAIANSASDYLEPYGIIALETGFDQAAEVCALFQSCGFLKNRVYRDLARQDRVVVFERFF